MVVAKLVCLVDFQLLTFQKHLRSASFGNHARGLCGSIARDSRRPGRHRCLLLPLVLRLQTARPRSEQIRSGGKQLLLPAAFPNGAVISSDCCPKNIVAAPTWLPDTRLAEGSGRQACRRTCTSRSICFLASTVACCCGAPS